MRLKELREAKGYSQGKLAKLSGVTRENINRIERGKQIPTVPTLDKLRKPLECSIEDLISEG